MIGFPFLLFEFVIGKKLKGSIVKAINFKLAKNSTLGWAIGLNCFVIVTYYTVILAWSACYLVATFSKSWFDSPENYFYHDLINVSDGPFEFGSPQLSVVAGLFFIWILIFWITSGKINRLEKVLKFCVILPVIILVAFLIRAISLPGANEGMHKFISPDISLIFKVDTFEKC